ncbi:MAG: hypothetical protein JW827_05915 [Spirochaetes bacterium]|nr:hypothetical protein [Spirochaetota bacterium]
MKHYGTFKNNGWEYHIKRPDLPHPWYNYLFNNKYHNIISHTGGGFSYAIDPKVNRLLRYDNVDNDLPGRYVFLKMAGKIWSANWQPLKQDVQSWLTVVSPGFTRIRSKHYDIESQIDYCVPLDDTIEIWSVTLTNRTKKKIKIEAYPFVDIIAGDADLEARYRNIMRLYNVAEGSIKERSLIFTKMPFPHREIENYTFFITDTKVKSFETNKLEFFGMHHTIEDPVGLKKKSLSNSPNRGEDMVGVFQVDLELKPDQSRHFNVILGFAENRSDIKKIKKKYFQTKDVIPETIQRTRTAWKNILERLWVTTHDEELDRMVNIWGKYQLLAITRWRGTSPYHGTEGGLGYRDLAQDVEGIAGLDRDLARKKLMDLLRFQFSNGNAVSGFSVIEGAWDINPEAKIVSGKSDVAIWLPNAVIKYIKETGDFKFLRTRVKYLDKGEDTVYDHIIKAVEYVSRSIGKHGLPLIKIADWNDAYDRIGTKNKGESIWLGEAVCWAALIVKEMAGYLKDNKTVNRMDNIYQKMKKAVNQWGWNGKHYIAAYNDHGEKIGDRSIPLNSQTWAILGQVYDKSKLPYVLKAIDSLDTPYGPVLFKPPYHKFNPKIGRVTAFAEGTKENAAVFSHAVAFKIVADCMVSRNKEAFQTMKKLIPTSRAKQDADKYKVEPYVWAEYVIGPGNKNYGQGTFTWNTGTAVWTYIGATEWIIGVKPDFNGLRIEPRLPQNINNVRMKRIFRDTRYNILIQQGQRERNLIVDGKAVKGNLVPLFKDKRVHKVIYNY